MTLSSVSIPVRNRKWIDIETQRSHDQQRYQVSKAMTRLLRHDQTVPREIDGAVLFDEVLEVCRKKKSLRNGQFTNGYQLWQKEEE